MKAPFTRQQQESLGVMKNTLQGMWQLEVAQAERRLFSDIAALRSVLVNKGLVTAEELDAAKAEFEAGLSVEEALNPELQKVWGRSQRRVRRDSRAAAETKEEETPPT